MVNATATWSQADEICRNLGAQLAVIPSAAVGNSLRKAFDLNKSYAIGQQVWIGIKAPWKNWSDGSSVSYTNWATKQPDSAEGTTYLYCGTFVLTTLSKDSKWGTTRGVWNDYPSIAQLVGDSMIIQRVIGSIPELLSMAKRHAIIGLELSLEFNLGPFERYLPRVSAAMASIVVPLLLLVFVEILQGFDVKYNISAEQVIAGELYGVEPWEVGCKF
ncbi:unnamed protein product [Caenorhabditis auriculariae]|uniref:C-type lectin domain-containing protein n=1 Tax=Caenorhabditis auriculariae TaxID=2777116 RepID=A0A8S1HML0_9PELO|nr:unnamed protein product [Caenorhabditis auriculariae]